MRDLTDRASIRDIAKAAKTSVSTVSRALNNHPDVSAETRERILRIAKACGYERNVFAHSLISGRSGLISVVMPDIDYDYQLQFLRGLAGAAQRYDQELLLTVKDTAGEAIEACRSMYRRGIADGVIISARLDYRRSSNPSHASVSWHWRCCWSCWITRRYPVSAFRCRWNLLSAAAVARHVQENPRAPGLVGQRCVWKVSRQMRPVGQFP